MTIPTFTSLVPTSITTAIFNQQSSLTPSKPTTQTTSTATTSALTAPKSTEVLQVLHQRHQLCHYLYLCKQDLPVNQLQQHI